MPTETKAPPTITLSAPTYKVSDEDGNIVEMVARERQLAMGGEGVGKSYMWQTYLANTPDDVTFFVIDTDACWAPAAASEEFRPYAHRVRPTVPDTWLDYKRGIIKAMNNGKPNDWLVIDLGDHAWDAAQEYYEERKFEQANKSDDPAAFINAIIDDTIGDDDTRAKWGAINKTYAPLRAALIKFPGHVFVATTAKEFKKKKDGTYFQEDRDNIREFGSIGFKPGGQKHIGHDLNTVLLLTKDGRGVRNIKVVKDRNREHKWTKDTIRHTDASKDILLGIAGWIPKVA